MKAFDKVSHKRLIKILKYYSLPLKVIDWIKSFLINRKQRVLVNGLVSGWHDVSGVVQIYFIKEMKTFLHIGLTHSLQIEQKSTKHPKFLIALKAMKSVALFSSIDLLWLF